MVDKLNLNYSGNQINAEPISVPSASPYTARTLHNRLITGSVEIWQNNDKTGTQLTEEPYTGIVSESGKFQVDYTGAQDGDVQYRNTILFHSAQAGTNWFIWYKSIGDIIDANDFNAKVDKVVGGTEDNLVVLDSIGKIKDSGKKISDFEPVIPVKKTAFNKDFGTAADTVCEGNDSRLSDTRIPKAHASTHVTGGTDVIPNAVAGGNSGLMTGADKQNLNDVVAKKHEHTNKALLDTYTQTENNLADAVAKKHTQGTDTTLGKMTADIDMNSKSIINLPAPSAVNHALRQTAKITEAMLEKTLYITENAQTGTTYTLVIDDDHKLVSFSNSSAITLTIPTNESVAFPVGTQILILQKGTGQVTIGKATGVTVNSVNGANKTVAQYSMAGLIKLATDTWILFGDLEA